MNVRWFLAGVGAVAVVLLVIGGTRMPGSAPGLPSGGAGCDAAAKPADMGFSMKDISGATVDLSALKGKVVLLDFWATWCGPCKVEIPGFIELQDKYRDKGLVVIGVSVDDTLAQLKEFSAAYKMNYPVVVGSAHEDIQKAYGPIWGLPTTFIIGRDGRLCSKHVGLNSMATFEKDILGLL
jgi:thiol-disulfide isomerase/thioredoxin